jgi:LysM repeat protein
MRLGSGHCFVPVLILGIFSVALAGCTSSGSVSVAPISTGSVPSRPSEPVGRDWQRSSSADSYGYGQPYRLSSNNTPARQYTDPGTPTSREYASNSYGGGARSVETGSLGKGYSTARYETGYTQPRATSPNAPGSVARAERDIIEVREGDTLYSLSRRYNVPVPDLVAANRLPNERIAIGQRLVIPTRYR